jgi:hypothetical protein
MSTKQVTPSYSRQSHVSLDPAPLGERPGLRISREVAHEMILVATGRPSGLKSALAAEAITAELRTLNGFVARLCVSLERSGTHAAI